MKGFTLLELAIGIAVFCILSCLSLSALSWMYGKEQSIVTADEIKQAIHLAKLQSIASSQVLTLAPINQQDWTSGIQLFIDNPKHHYDGKALLLREWLWKNRKISVIWSGFESNNYLRFSPDLNERACSGRFTIQSRTANKILLVVNRLGRVNESKLS